MTEVNTKLSVDVVKFCERFPQGRLCRLVNRRSGTLLDVRSLNLVNDAVPQVVGNAENDGVQYWIITPHGDGQAIIPVPRDGSNKVRYLTPSSVNETRPVTVSPFPASWQILPSSDCPVIVGSPLTGSSVPQGLYEEWTCQICWPHFRNGEPRMLDLWAGLATANNPVVVYPLSGTQWQFWRIQFVRYQSKPNDGSDHVDNGTDADTDELPDNHVTSPNPTSARNIWIENILQTDVQILIMPTSAADDTCPIFFGPWITSQDGQSIDAWQLTRSLPLPLQADTTFHLGVRSSEGWTYNVSRVFALADSASVAGFNAYIRGTATVPHFRFW